MPPKPRTCRHLRRLEEALLLAGHEPTFAGAAWGADTTREWIYFDLIFDRPRIRASFELAPCVIDHEHLGTHDGQEAGLVCTEHRDAVMGIHPVAGVRRPVYPSPELG